MDSSEVYGLEGGSYSESHGRPANSQRPPSVALVHLPTGITISRNASTGHDSPKEAKTIRQSLKAERFGELERWVPRIGDGPCTIAEALASRCRTVAGARWVPHHSP